MLPAAPGDVAAIAVRRPQVVAAAYVLVPALRTLLGAAELPWMTKNTGHTQDASHAHISPRRNAVRAIAIVSTGPPRSGDEGARECLDLPNFYVGHRNGWVQFAL